MSLEPGKPPDYPPKTPPPPKKPVSPPRPNTTTPAPTRSTLLRSGRRGVTMVNRRGMNWKLESAPWAAGKARTAVSDQLAKWRHVFTSTVGRTIEAVTTVLVDATVADGGTHVSLHLSGQDGQVCIVVLSHRSALRAGHETEGDDVLRRITAHLAVTGCGSDTGPDGRRLWAVIALSGT